MVSTANLHPYTPGTENAPRVRLLSGGGGERGTPSDLAPFARAASRIQRAARDFMGGSDLQARRQRLVDMVGDVAGQAERLCSLGFVDRDTVEAVKRTMKDAFRSEAHFTREVWGSASLTPRLKAPSFKTST